MGAHRQQVKQVVQAKHVHKLQVRRLAAMGGNRTWANGWRHSPQRGKSGARSHKSSPITNQPSEASITTPFIQRFRTKIMA